MKKPPSPSDSEKAKQNSTPVRKGEAVKFWFRGDRFLQIDNQWFFTIREGRDVGPFLSRKNADHGLTLFIECLQKQFATVDYAISVAKEGDWSMGYYQ